MSDPLLAVSALLVANQIEVTDGLCHVTSGGWSTLELERLPSDFRFPVLLVIEAGGVPVGDYALQVELIAPGGRTAGRTSFPLTVIAPGDVLRISTFVPLIAHVFEEGTHRLQVSTDTTVLASQGLVVRSCGGSPDPTPIDWGSPPD